jgi:formate dehydrogenase alpha subunit
MFQASLEGKLKAMYIMGEDPVLTDANANHVRRGLEALDFLVVQDLFLTETAKLADVVLPGASFAEKTGTFTNTERRVQMVNKAIDPLGKAKADWRIICDLAGRMGYHFIYKSTAEIMQEIASLTPQYAGIHHERLGSRGMQWPVLVRITMERSTFIKIHSQEARVFSCRLKRGYRMSCLTRNIRSC